MAREPAIPRFSLALQAGDLAWAFSRLRRGDPGALARFEQEFASWLGVRRAFFLPSARTGMYLVLKELGLPPGTRVLVPAQTHPSVPAMVLAAGLVPRIVDISEGTWCMEPSNIPPEAWEGVGAVMATHLYGCPARVVELADECQRRGAVLLEDCAQGLGAEVEGGRRAGTTGRASFFSFTLTKNFTTLGGGMVAFQDEELAGRVERALAGLGQEPCRRLLPAMVRAAAMLAATSRPVFHLTVYPALRLGWKIWGRDVLHPWFEEPPPSLEPPRLRARPSPLQAALGLRLLGQVDAHNRRRSENGWSLLSRLHHSAPPGLGLPRLPQKGRHIFMSFVVTWRDPARLASELLAQGIDSSPGYLRPVHRIAALRPHLEVFGSLPVAERLEREQLHLPVHPGVVGADLDRIARALTEIVERAGAPAPVPSEAGSLSG